MGIFTGLRVRRQADAISASLSGVTDPSRFPLATPWSSGDLQRIVFEDVFGSELPVNTRNAAMRLGTIARARNLVVSALSAAPLYELEDGQRVEHQPAWITQTGDGSSPELRTAWTVDDLIFYGWSCWSRHWDGDTEVARSRINQDDWTVNEDGRVEVNGVEVADRDVILIPGLHEGLLSFGIDVLGDARALYAAVRKRIQNPAAAIDLHQTDGPDLTDDEIDALVDRYAAQRARTNGAIGYTSRNLEINELGAQADAQLMIEARNAAADDLARIIGVHAGMVDATAPKASLNYETQTGRNQEFVDFDLALYMTPLTARLSLDDVTAPGRRVAFDLSNLTDPAPSPTGPRFED